MTKHNLKAFITLKSQLAVLDKNSIVSIYIQLKNARKYIRKDRVVKYADISEYRDYLVVSVTPDGLSTQIRIIDPVDLQKQIDDAGIPAKIGRKLLHESVSEYISRSNPNKCSVTKTRNTESTFSEHAATARRLSNKKYKENSRQNSDYAI